LSFRQYQIAQTLQNFDDTPPCTGTRLEASAAYAAAASLLIASHREHCKRALVSFMTIFQHIPSRVARCQATPKIP